MHRLVSFSAGIVTLDTIITVFFWELETNPIVIDMGMDSWILLKILLVGSIPVAWELGAKEFTIGKVCVALLSILYTVVVTTNLLYLFSTLI